MGLDGSGVLLEPGLETLEVSAALVVSRGVLGALGVELDGGVAADVNAVDLVGGGVHLGNGQAGDVLEVGSQLVVDGSELLAVAAPGSVELHQHVVVVVDDKLSELLADEDLDGLAVVSRDLLRLEEWLEGTSLEVLDELSESLDGDALSFAGEGVLLHVVGGVKEADGGEVALLNADELSEALLDALGGTGDNEEDLALELGGSLGEDLGERAVGVVGTTEEENGGLALAKDGLDEVLTEGDQGGHSRGLKPVDNGAALPAARVDNSRGVELAEEDQSRAAAGSKLAAAGCVVDVEELVLLGDGTVLSNLEEDLRELLGRGVTDEGDGELGGISSVLESSASRLRGGRADSLEHPVHDVVLASAAGVLGLLSLPRAQG